MNNILLSIIIPVYNTEKELLIECLNSIKKELNTKVISQERIEIIIVNDGSSNTSTLDFLENLENIKIINQDNRGQAAAKNTGIKVAVGEYIFPLDSDDILKKLHLVMNMIFYLEIFMYLEIVNIVTN